MNGLAGELRAAVQRHQLDEKRQGVHLAAEPLDEVGRRARRAAGREQVVDDQDPLPLASPHPRGSRASRCRTRGRRSRGRRPTAACPACAPARSRRRSDRRRRAEDEAAALDADDDVDALILEGEREAVDRRAKAHRILQQRGDVVEEDPRLGKIGDVANLGFQIVHGHATVKPVSRPLGTVPSTST